MTRTRARDAAVRLICAQAATGQEPDGLVDDYFEPEHLASLAGEEGERTLQAMAATIGGYYGDSLEELSLRCQGEELTVNGKTAQDFLGGQLTVTRTGETDYRE